MRTHVGRIVETLNPPILVMWRHTFQFIMDNDGKNQKRTMKTRSNLQSHCRGQGLVHKLRTVSLYHLLLNSRHRRRSHCAFPASQNEGKNE
jgi:hypothetical protein